MLAGVLLSIAWLRTHGLWLPWGIHFAWNASIGLLFGLPVRGDIGSRASSYPMPTVPSGSPAETMAPKPHSSPACLSSSASSFSSASPATTPGTTPTRPSYPAATLWTSHRRPPTPLWNSKPPPARHPSSRSFPPPRRAAQSTKNPSPNRLLNITSSQICQYFVSKLQFRYHLIKTRVRRLVKREQKAQDLGI